MTNQFDDYVNADFWIGLISPRESSRFGGINVGLMADIQDVATAVASFLSSGTKTEGVGLEQALLHLYTGDTLVVWKLD